MINHHRNVINKLKPIIIGVVTLLLLICCTSHKTEVKSSSEVFSKLKVITFNIRYGSADDGENSWTYRKHILVDVIKDFNPDLLNMQEVLKFQLDELLEEMPSYSYVGVGRDNGKTAGEYSPIFFSKDRFILDTTETFWLSDTPDIPGSKTWGNNFTRICTWAKLFDKFAGRSFYLLNVHLDHQSVQSRIKSAGALVEKLRSINERLPIILTGDFNTGEDEKTIKTILESGLIDSYRNLYTKTLLSR